MSTVLLFISHNTRLSQNATKYTNDFLIKCYLHRAHLHHFLSHLPPNPEFKIHNLILCCFVFEKLCSTYRKLTWLLQHDSPLQFRHACTQWSPFFLHVHVLVLHGRSPAVLHLHLIIFSNSGGAMLSVVWMGLRTSPQIFHPQSVGGLTKLPSDDQVIIWWCALNPCRRAASSVGGNFSGSIFPYKPCPYICCICKKKQYS